MRLFGRHDNPKPLHQATMVICGWQTFCSHCGLTARAEELMHERTASGDKRGCGARFTAFTIKDPRSELDVEMAKKAHQRLIYISYADFLIGLGR